MSDIQEPTAWEDLGPVRTGLVRQPEPPSRSLARPATEDDFRTELTACLALCVPSGMTEESRRDWLLTAWGTLRHLPADLLRQGCAKARQVCDHPAKIVPVIIADTEEQLRQRGNGNVSDHLALPPPNWRTAEEQFNDWLSDMRGGMIPQRLIDDKPAQWQRLAVERGALRYSQEGKFVQRERFVDRQT